MARSGRDLSHDEAAWDLHHCRRLAVRSRRTSHPAPALERPVTITMMRAPTVEQARSSPGTRTFAIFG